MPIDWSSGLAIQKAWNRVQDRFRRRRCSECGRYDTSTYIVSVIGKNEDLIVLGCWDCGRAKPIAKLKGDQT